MTKGHAAMQPSHPQPARRLMLAALAGVVSALAGLGIGEITAAAVAPSASPVLVVGAWIIDLVPGWVKELVIALFGTNDKIFLIVCIVLTVTLAAAGAGILERIRPPIGRVLCAVGGVIGVVAAITRANAEWAHLLPSITAALAAVIALTLLRVRLPSTAPESASADSLARRRFLIFAGATGGVGVLAAITGQLLSASSRAVDAARSVLSLPRPAVPASPIPPGAAFEVPGLAPLITPNPVFYRIDTALRVPRIDPNQWSLKVTGDVDRDVVVTFDELLALPLIESRTTLVCVSNPVGGGLVGTATWLGYPIRELLAAAGPHESSDMVLSTSVDGWTAGTPLKVLTDDRNAILAVGMNGRPLPLEHGFPVRMVVPGLYGYVSATKWLAELRVTRFDRESAYWTSRGWAARGPIKLSSRIDVPRAGATLSAGPTVVAGVAWSPHRGIAAVQVQVDDEPWRSANLSEPLTVDVWRQWRLEWEAAPGAHVLRVRAIDATGLVQTAEVASVLPDGATGLDAIPVRVD